MEFSGGFHTLDQAVQLKPFGRGSFYVKARHRTSGVTSTDWNTSFWMDDTLTDDKGDWSSSQGKRSFESDNKATMDITAVPFLDDSGSTKYLKFAFGYNVHPGDDFEDLMEGERVCLAGGGCGSSGDNVHKSATGIAFEEGGHGLVAGHHTIRFEVKHDHSKASSRKWWTYTCVMSSVDTGSGIYYIYTRFGRKSADHPGPAPTSIPEADVIAMSGGSGVTYWAGWFAKWDSSTQQWSITNDDDFWRGFVSNATTETTALADGSGVQKLQEGYYVDADADDHIMWNFTTIST